jgi:HAMP domain-containing protein
MMEVADCWTITVICTFNKKSIYRTQGIFFIYLLLFKKIFSYKAKRLLTRASKRTHRKTSDISIESYPAKVNTNFDSCKKERKEQTQQNQMNCLDTDALEMLQKEPSLLIPCLNK